MRIDEFSQWQCFVLCLILSKNEQTNINYFRSLIQKQFQK